MRTNATTPESYLGREGLTPDVRISRLVISFLQWRFSLLPAGAYHWNPESEMTDDQETSEIYLGYSTPVDPSRVGQRPAITACIDGYQFQGLSIGDLAFIDLQTGGEVKMDLIPAALRIYVLSRHPIEAKRLAWFVVEQIWSFRWAILSKDSSLHHLGPRPTVSPATPAGTLVSPGTEHEWSCVTIQFPAFLQHSSTLMPLNKSILKEARATTRLPQEGGSGAQSGKIEE